MKTNRIIISMAIITLTWSCKKDGLFGSEVEYDGGIVKQSNSSLPAQYVNVSLISMDGQGNNSIVQTMVTDAQGKFSIPGNTTATHVVASGDPNYYDFPSAQFSLANYKQEGGTVFVTLIPNAWLRFNISDSAPLDSSVSSLQTFGGSGVITLQDQALIKCTGNVPYNISYRFTYHGGGVSDWFSLSIPAPAGLDTTDVFLNY
jgi:hypothetical protein